MYVDGRLRPIERCSSRAPLAFRVLASSLLMDGVGRESILNRDQSTTLRIWHYGMERQPMGRVGKQEVGTLIVANDKSLASGHEFPLPFDINFPQPLPLFLLLYL